MEERLQKILARAGLASRRGAEEMILAGRVAVDGQVITSLGSKADIDSQTVTLDNKPVGKKPDYHYWMLHKPPGVVSTKSDPQNRRTIMGFVPAHLREMLYPVGRLDFDSEGLMLLTNDGELAYRLMHPRFKVPKFYKAWVSGQPEDDSLERLRQGIFIEGKKTAPAEVELLRAGIYRSQLSFTLVEGRKREIRLMCQAIGHPVIQLVRLKLGSVTLGSLEKGKARSLSQAEVNSLKNLVGITTPAKRPRFGYGGPGRSGGPGKPDGSGKPGNRPNRAEGKSKGAQKKPGTRGCRQ